LSVPPSVPPSLITSYECKVGRSFRLRYIATIVPETVIDRPAATSDGPEQGTDEKDS